jgi:regulator of protease activity HflC (stomatin/prohibitin superfamily)
MIYIGLMLFLVALLVVAGGGGLLVGKMSRGETKEGAYGVAVIAIIGVPLIMVALTLGASIRQVKAGEVGMVYQFGDIVGQRDAGINLIAPWQGFKTTSIQTQKIRPETSCDGGAIEECLEAFSEETQNVFIRPTINLSVSPDAVQELFRNVGPNYIDKLVRPRLHQIFKDETVKFTSVDIAPSREVIRAAVRDRLISELAGFSITVEDLLVDNISFSSTFEDAIEAKQVASQEAQRQAELVVAAKQQALQAIKKAEGEAGANEVLAASLRENGNFILQFRAIEALADDVKIIMLPTDSGIIPILGESFLTGTGPAPARVP